MRLKEFKTVLAEELKKPSPDGKDKQRALTFMLWAGVVGSIVWGVWAVAAAVMLVSFGAWGWVVWPMALYWWTHHVGRVGKTYAAAKKAPAKWEQHVTVNVSAHPEMTAEQISEAAARAVNDKLRYAL